jgi:CheY-like chemotaxis protein
MTKILILEDEKEMRNKHVRWLEAAGFKCCPTHDGRQAIAWAKRDSAIKFALIDHILKVQPIPEGEEGENQQFTGEGVIREINTERLDMEFIFVTFAPQEEAQRSENPFKLLDVAYKLKYENRGIIDFVHRYDIERDEESVYTRIIELIRGRVRAAEEYFLTYIADDQKRIKCAHYVCKVTPLRSIDSRVEREKSVSGTGWLVAPSLILTCWHVIEARHPLEPNASAEDLNRQISNCIVEFHHWQVANDGVNYEIEECLHHNVDLDYALLRLKNRTERHYHLGCNDFLRVDMEAPINEQTLFLVIQHARGNPLQRSHGWFVQRSIKKDVVWHNALTHEGTSGSPTFDAVHFRVVAMHRGRDESKDLAEAVLVKAIMNDLKRNCPELYKEIIQAQKRLQRSRS